MVKLVKFREDLYYRLDVIRVQIPPICDRKEDIIPMAEHFLAQYAEELGKPRLKLGVSALNSILNYDWPGNARELKNTVKRAVALSNNSVLESDDIFIVPTLQSMPGKLELKRSPEPNTLEEGQREQIKRALIANNWNYSKTSKQLGIGRTTLWRKVKKYDLKSMSVVS